MAKKWDEIKIKEYINKFNYEVLNCYYDDKKSKWKLILMCSKFHIFKIDFDKFQQGKRCSYCNGSKFDEDFVREYMLNNGDRLMSHYHNMNEKLKVMCKHKHIYYPTFGNYYNKNSRCPYCEGNAKKEHEQFIKEIKIKNPNIEILGEYKGSHVKIKCKCKIDKCVWYPTPSSLLYSDTGCPECYKRIYKGETHPLYNHNITEEERKNKRNFHEYREWRIKCYERDNYTCQVTGIRGGDLVVHHLYSYNKYRCLRTVVENGITISKDIHDLFHSIYGYGNNTLEQWEEFINNLK